MVGLAPQLITVVMLAAGEVDAPRPSAAGAATARLQGPARDAAQFAPRGWAIETEARGDLNGDGAADLVFVALAPDRPGAPLRSSPYGEDPSSYANPRMLGIAWGLQNGGYRLAVADRRFLPPKWAPNGLSQGWMLFEPGSVEVSRGRLRVIFDYTRSHRTFTFRWQDGELRLTGYDSGGVGAGCATHSSVNFLTSRMRLTAGHIDRDETRVVWRRLPRRPLLSLEEIGEGEEFDGLGEITGPALECPPRE